MGEVKDGATLVAPAALLLSCCAAAFVVTGGGAVHELAHETSSPTLCSPAGRPAASTNKPLLPPTCNCRHLIPASLPPHLCSYGYAQHAQQAIDPGQAALDAAFAAEQERASRQGGADPFAAAGIQFKEVRLCASFSGRWWRWQRRGMWRG